MLFASQTSLFIFKRDNAPSAHFIAWRYKNDVNFKRHKYPFLNKLIQKQGCITQKTQLGK